MAAYDSVRVCECRYCDRDDLTPAGVTNHETWCDENPHRGIPPEKVNELREQGVID